MRVLKLFGLLLLVAVLAAAIGGWLGYREYQAFLDRPLQLPAAVGETEPEVLSVAPGTSMQALSEELERRGIIGSALLLQLYARLEGLATRIQTGDYALTPDLNPRTLLAKLTSGDVITYGVTIPEGWTFRQMLTALHASPFIEHTLNGLDDAAIMAKLGHPEQHPEGRFFPDTYRFPKNTPDIAILRRAYAAMERELAAAWAERAPDIPIASAYEALILASIIEKETGRADERGQIAGVFSRRLQQGMRLQTDPTVIYGMGERFDGNIRRADLRRDTPYNTYTRNGLPPTPIALPGRASLRAAVNPQPGDTLFFVAKGDGSHAFSRTLAEHNRNVRKYQLNKR